MFLIAKTRKNTNFPSGLHRKHSKSEPALSCNLKMNTKIRLFFILCLIFPMVLFSQRPSLEKLTNRTALDVAPKVDTLGKDSLKVNIIKTLKISKDALDEPVEYKAKDSIIFENSKNLIHLYGDASVKYQTIEVKAAYIVLNIKENLATAEARKDSSGRTAGVPVFSDKDQTFKSQKMRYNFKNKKGVVYDVQTLQQNLYVLGEKTKFVGKKDSTQNDVIYSKNAILTTCSDPHPHFGIRANKMKVIANKLIIVGPSNLEIGGVPTPVWLPFGFYPVTKTKQTGLIFPNYYGFRPGQGLGLEGIGWYFPINKHHDLKLTANAYTVGSWGLRAESNYNYRYKFSGNFTLSYDNLVTEKELVKTSNRPISITWRHTQDSKARPNQSFSANINIQTNAQVLQRNVLNSVPDVRSNSNSSGINYARQFPGKPFNFTAGIQQNQNIRTHVMVLEPTINLNVNTLYPLKKLKRQGKDDLLNTIYEGFNISTGANMRANMNTYDTLLFKKETYEKRLRAGLAYNANASVPLNIFKIITISPNANFSQNVNFDQIKKIYRDTQFVRKVPTTDASGKPTTKDEIVYGKIDTVKSWGLNPVTNFNMGVSANTILYGTKQFKKGYFRGIRHQMNASVGFNYAPNLNKAAWCDSIRLPSTDKNLRKKSEYSVFEGSVLGTPSCDRISKGNKFINISTTHNLQIKVKGRKDSIAKKIVILNNLDISTSIDLNKDTLRMSRFMPSINQNILYGLVNLSLRTTFTPYVQGRKTSNSTTWNDTRDYAWDKKSIYATENGKFRIPKPVLFEQANFNISSRASIKEIRDLINKKSGVAKVDTTKNSLKKPTKDSEKTSENLRDVISLIENFSLSHVMNFEMNRNTKNNKDTIFMNTNNITLNGSIPLSNNWRLDFGSIGYDFGTKRPTYAALGIFRDLHCWDIGGSWYPTRGTFFFTLKVKSAPLDFLKAPIQKQNAYLF